ncbi:MAG: PTS IIA-like nitrogen regulatory protein PtsN [Minwuia sp.]|uniref:PTS IIA-like nitrogen regulatory protein PtsN n=1 Tax=Minwuia sp. TaxID=2493630 RepID=UPI003A87BD34
MDITDLLEPESVVFNLKAGSKKQVLQALARHAAETTGLHERLIFDTLLERERLGTTGVGDGVAIPHGRIGEIDRISGLFARLKDPVDFDSVDGKPVDLLFLLLAPAQAGADHLKALSKISRLLRDRDNCEKLRGAKSADALYALLSSGGTSQAA